MKGSPLATAHYRDAISSSTQVIELCHVMPFTLRAAGDSYPTYQTEMNRFASVEFG
jgi:hypothetical protein